jgi:hypothetical protein
MRGNISCYNKAAPGNSRGRFAFADIFGKPLVHNERTNQQGQHLIFS